MILLGIPPAFLGFTFSNLSSHGWMVGCIIGQSLLVGRAESVVTGGHGLRCGSVWDKGQNGLPVRQGWGRDCVIISLFVFVWSWGSGCFPDWSILDWGFPIVTSNVINLIGL